MDGEQFSRELRDQLISRARQMRAEPTQAEALLWDQLRMRQLGGLRFRRQHIIHTFIVDFYCPAAKMVVEIDGSVHANQEEYDQERETYLEAMGYKVIRFGSADVVENIELVLAGIYDACMNQIEKENVN